MAILQFSSRSIAGGRGCAERVRRSYGALLNRALGVDVESLGPDLPLIDARMRILPGVVIARQDLSPLRMTRSAAHLSDGQDGLILSIPLHGTARYRSKGRPAAECSAGTAMVFDAGREHVIENTGMARLSIRLPRKAVEARLSDLPEAPLRTTPALRLLADYAACLLTRDDTFGPAESRAIAAHVTELAILAMAPGRAAQDPAHGGVRAARLSAICAEMAARLEDPDLALAQIAAAHGISVQYARALFNARGTTFHDHLRALRIGRAQELLASPERGRKISAVAFECGFNDLSYFNRAFRQATGMTPGDWRARSQPRDSRV